MSALLLAVILYTLLNQPQKSIVVLPFKNLSDEPGNQYFADGIMEDILNNLFRISELRVVSRTSSEYFRESPMTSPEIARKMNVDYVLEGSVQKQGGEVRIFTQLIDARNDRHLLSEKYEGEMENIFDFQSDIAAKVAGALQAVSRAMTSILILVITTGSSSFIISTWAKARKRQKFSGMFFSPTHSLNPTLT